MSTIHRYDSHTDKTDGNATNALARLRGRVPEQLLDRGSIDWSHSVVTTYVCQISVTVISWWLIVEMLRSSRCSWVSFLRSGNPPEIVCYIRYNDNMRTGGDEGGAGWHACTNAYNKHDHNRPKDRQEANTTQTAKNRTAYQRNYTQLSIQGCCSIIGDVGHDNAMANHLQYYVGASNHFRLLSW